LGSYYVESVGILMFSSFVTVAVQHKQEQIFS